jgi:hypothetical protein
MAERLLPVPADVLRTLALLAGHVDDLDDDELAAVQRAEDLLRDGIGYRQDQAVKR